MVAFAEDISRLVTDLSNLRGRVQSLHDSMIPPSSTKSEIRQALRDIDRALVDMSQALLEDVN